VILSSRTFEENELRNFTGETLTRQLRRRRWVKKDCMDRRETHWERENNLHKQD
jgi:hypothetical protein